MLTLCTQLLNECGCIPGTCVILQAEHYSDEVCTNFSEKLFQYVYAGTDFN